MSEHRDYPYVTSPEQAERLGRKHHKLPPYEEGIVPSGHPVDTMLAMGAVMTPEQEARLRAYCDEVVELNSDERTK